MASTPASNEGVASMPVMHGADDLHKKDVGNGAASPPISRAPTVNFAQRKDAVTTSRDQRKFPPGSLASIKDPEDGTTRISLYRVLLDIEEYHGFNRLIMFLLFFVSGVLLLYTQWGGLSSNAPAFRTTMAESFKLILCGQEVGFIPLAAQQPVTIEEVRDIPTALDYMSGWLGCAVNTTEHLKVANDTAVWSGEFGYVTFVRLLVDLDTNCKKRDSLLKEAVDQECYKKQNIYKNQSPLSSLWDAPNDTRKVHKDEWIAVLKSPNMTRQQVQFRLRDIIMGNVSEGNSTYNDRAAIGKYAFSLKMQVFAFDRLGQDSAYFSIGVKYAGYDYHKTVRQIATSTSPPLPTAFHAAWFALFVVCNIVYTLKELSTCRVVYLQVINYMAMPRRWPYCRLLAA